VLQVEIAAVHDLLGAALKAVPTAAVGVDVDEAGAEVVARHIKDLVGGALLGSHVGDDTVFNIYVPVKQTVFQYDLIGFYSFHRAYHRKRFEFFVSNSIVSPSDKGNFKASSSSAYCKFLSAFFRTIFITTSKFYFMERNRVRIVEIVRLIKSCTR